MEDAKNLLKPKAYEGGPPQDFDSASVNSHPYAVPDESPMGAQHLRPSNDLIKIDYNDSMMGSELPPADEIFRI